ncbi:MAG: lactate utilization protein [Syntrophales bacterium]
MTEPMNMFTSREPIKQFWRVRLERVRKALEKNNFETFLVDSALDAKRLVMEEILPKVGAENISWGGSMTMEEIGLGEALRQQEDITLLDPIKEGISLGDLRKGMLLSLSADVFFSGTNAVTEAGQLVNLDMYGNRVAAITFGPKHVVILAGRNKIVHDLEAATDRIRNYVAPAHVRRMNALGMGYNNPCMESSVCQNCKSPTRLCNAWGIIEKSYPQGRIKVVLINEDIGL